MTSLGDWRVVVASQSQLQHVARSSQGRRSCIAVTSQSLWTTHLVRQKRTLNVVNWRPIAIKKQISNSTRSDQPFQKLIYSIRYSQSSITFAVFDVFVCISFMCLRVHVDLIQPLAAINNKTLFVCLWPWSIEPMTILATVDVRPTTVFTLNIHLCV